MSPVFSTISGVGLRVHVQPGASKNQIVGMHGERLKIKIKAPPEDGKANIALCEFVAEALGISKSSVRVLTGASSRGKTLEIFGMSIADVSEKLL